MSTEGVSGSGRGAPPGPAEDSSGQQPTTCCWICLEHSDTLELPCSCPRPVHKQCLARWNLQSAGNPEERHCRFCGDEYPDWRTALTSPGLQPATPVMAVFVRGKAYKVKVKPGAEGQKEFQRTIKKLMGLPAAAVFDVVFECKAPNTGERLQLRGLGAFDAAAHCAAVSAAKRKLAKSQKHPSGSPASVSGGAAGELGAAVAGDAVGPLDVEATRDTSDGQTDAEPPTDDAEAPADVALPEQEQQVQLQQQHVLAAAVAAAAAAQAGSSSRSMSAPGAKTATPAPSGLRGRLQPRERRLLPRRASSEDGSARLDSVATEAAPVPGINLGLRFGSCPMSTLNPVLWSAPADAASRGAGGGVGLALLGLSAPEPAAAAGAALRHADAAAAAAAAAAVMADAALSATVAAAPAGAGARAELPPSGRDQSPTPRVAVQAVQGGGLSPLDKPGSEGAAAAGGESGDGAAKSVPLLSRLRGLFSGLSCN